MTEVDGMMNKRMAMFVAILAAGSLISMQATAEMNQVQQTWIRVRGMVTDWGETSVLGWVHANARIADVNDTSREWANVHTVWSDEPRHINCTAPPTGNFTYTYYCAHLVNSTTIELNYSDNDLYITGLWNVYKVAVEYYIDEFGELVTYTISMEAIVTEGEGNIRVFGNWTGFQISITGIDPLSGTVYAHLVGNMEINIGDMNGNGKVNIEDLVGVAKKYGSMPGLGNYSFEMDINYDFKIDIGDLTTIAANLGQG